VEEQQSVASVALQKPLTGNSGVLPAAKPIVTIVRVISRTTKTPAKIEIAWKSDNYNDGNIIWGPANAPTLFTHPIKPVGTTYHGTFGTDHPLTSATPYVFQVAVRNTLHSKEWVSTTVLVRSAADTLSVRQFLLASGIPVTTSLTSVAGPAKSLRNLLLS
jgi:hypothetical protein